MTHIYSKLPMVLLFLVLVAFGYVIYLMVFPLEVFKPNIQPYKIMNENKTVKIGDNVIYQVDACKFMDISAISRRSFVNAIEINLPPKETSVVKGCNKTQMLVQVPNEIIPGTWHLEINIEYKINPLRSKIYHLKTENFQVVK